MPLRVFTCIDLLCKSWLAVTWQAVNLMLAQFIVSNFLQTALQSDLLATAPSPFSFNWDLRSRECQPRWVREDPMHWIWWENENSNLAMLCSNMVQCSELSWLAKVLTIDNIWRVKPGVPFFAGWRQKKLDRHSFHCAILYIPRIFWVADKCL